MGLLQPKAQLFSEHCRERLDVSRVLSPLPQLLALSGVGGGAVAKLQVVWSNSVDVLAYVHVLRRSLFGTTRCECKIKTI